MAPLTSNGVVIDTSPDKFGFLRESNDILDSGEALRQRMKEDGYLFLRGVLDREAVLGTRREILQKLSSIAEIDTRYPLMEAIRSGQSMRRQIDVRAFNRDLRNGEAFRGLCHGGKVVQFYERFFGESVRPFDYLWLRTVSVGQATGCHYDIVYMGRGTHNLYTSWIPLGDVPMIEGALMILEGSHRLDELKASYGAVDVDRDKVGGWYSKDPANVQEQFGGRWLSADFRTGDMLCFGMFTMHCSLDNQSPINRIRLSSDSRYQAASEPVDERWIGAEPIGHGGN